MSEKKSVMFIGLEPTVIDFSLPDFANTPGLDASKIQAGLDKAEEDLKSLGYDIEMCLTDTGETAEDVVRSRLLEKQFDCIIIGAGIRTVTTYFLLFEKLINVAHKNAPQAKICFNTTPGDSAQAVQRWI
jgi:DNA-binding LacI/PurR family transcriptional regulator